MSGNEAGLGRSLLYNMKLSLLQYSEEEECPEMGLSLWYGKSLHVQGVESPDIVQALRSPCMAKAWEVLAQEASHGKSCHRKPGTGRLWKSLYGQGMESPGTGSKAWKVSAQEARHGKSWLRKPGMESPGPGSQSGKL